MKKYDFNLSNGNAFASEMAVADMLAVTTANGGTSAAVADFGGQSVAVAMGRDAKSIAENGGFAAVAAGFMGRAVTHDNAVSVAVTRAETGKNGVAVSRAWVRGGEGAILICFDHRCVPHVTRVSGEILPDTWYTWEEHGARWRAAGEGEA